MATTAGERQRALIYLRSLELMLGDLPEVAAEWPTIPDVERESWSHDWDNEMGSLQVLTEYVAHGTLEEPEARRYQRIVETVRASLPIIARLNLRRPHFATNERAS